jgi:hypothetical protein
MNYNEHVRPARRFLGSIVVALIAAGLLPGGGDGTGASWRTSHPKESIASTAASPAVDVATGAVARIAGPTRFERHAAGSSALPVQTAAIARPGFATEAPHNSQSWHSSTPAPARGRAPPR